MMTMMTIALVMVVAMAMMTMMTIALVTVVAMAMMTMTTTEPVLRDQRDGLRRAQRPPDRRLTLATRPFEGRGPGS